MAKKYKKFAIRAKKRRVNPYAKHVEVNNPDVEFEDISLNPTLGLFLRQKLIGQKDGYTVLIYTKKEAQQLHKIIGDFLQLKEWKDE